MKTYRVELRLSKQEDGLWRAEAPALPGCFVDAPTLAEAVSDIQEVAAMFIDVFESEGRSLPDEVRLKDLGHLKATLVVAPGEHKFKRPAVRTRTRARSA